MTPSSFPGESCHRFPSALAAFRTERELRLGTRGIFFHQTTVDAYDLQRAFLEIVRLLRIQREDLPGYLAVSYDKRSN